MEKKAVGRSIYISVRKKSYVGILREQREQYPISRLTRRIKWQITMTAWQLGCLNWITW